MASCPASSHLPPPGPGQASGLRVVGRRGAGASVPSTIVLPVDMPATLVVRGFLSVGWQTGGGGGVRQTMAGC